MLRGVEMHTQPPITIESRLGLQKRLSKSAHIDGRPPASPADPGTVWGAKSCQRCSGNMAKGEPEAFIDVSHACIRRKVFLPFGRGDLDQATPGFERGRKIVLVLHDDF